jgi:hypothetical protein
MLRRPFRQILQPTAKSGFNAVIFEVLHFSVLPAAPCAWANTSFNFAKLGHFLFSVRLLMFAQSLGRVADIVYGLAIEPAFITKRQSKAIL